MKKFEELSNEQKVRLTEEFKSFLIELGVVVDMIIEFMQSFIEWIIPFYEERIGISEK